MTKILTELKKYSSKDKAEILSRFFKTGKGQYGYGDVFLGVMVPESRKIAKRLAYLGLEELSFSLGSKYHEERLVALFILVNKFKKSEDKKEIYDFYLKNIKSINNWDLVDQSAPYIVGEYLYEKEKSILEHLAKSENLWERRIAIISTLYFIREKNLEWTFKISKILLSDKHDLIHKAVGWMLRESWKINSKKVEEFLRENYSKIPRTTLRYAIERMPEVKRKKFLLNK